MRWWLVVLVAMICSCASKKSVEKDNTFIYNKGVSVESYREVAVDSVATYWFMTVTLNENGDTTRVDSEKIKEKYKARETEADKERTDTVYRNIVRTVTKTVEKDRGWAVTYGGWVLAVVMAVVVILRHKVSEPGHGGAGS